MFWVRGFFNSQVLSSVPTFTLMVPPEGVQDGTRYYCAVRNPENPAVDVGNRLSQTVAEVTNIPGNVKVMGYM